MFHLIFFFFVFVGFSMHLHSAQRFDCIDDLIIEIGKKTLPRYQTAHMQKAVARETELQRKINVQRNFAAL